MEGNPAEATPANKLQDKMGMVKFTKLSRNSGEDVNGHDIPSPYFWPAIIFESIEEFEEYREILSTFVSATEKPKLQLESLNYRKQQLETRLQSAPPEDPKLAYLIGRDPPKRVIYDNDEDVDEFLLGATVPLSAFQEAASFLSEKQDDPEFAANRLCFCNIPRPGTEAAQNEMIPWPAIKIREIKTFPRSIVDLKQQRTKGDLGLKTPNLKKDKLLQEALDIDSRNAIFLFGCPPMTSRRNIVPFEEDKVEFASTFPAIKLFECSSVPGYEEAMQEAMLLTRDCDAAMTNQKSIEPANNADEGKNLSVPKKGKKRPVLKDGTNNPPKPKRKKSAKKEKDSKDAIEPTTKPTGAPTKLDSFRARDVQKIPSFDDVKPHLEKVGHVFKEGAYSIPRGGTFHSLDEYRAYLCKEGIEVVGIPEREVNKMEEFHSVMAWVCYWQVERYLKDEEFSCTGDGSNAANSGKVNPADFSKIKYRIDNLEYPKLLKTMGFTVHSSKWEFPEGRRYDPKELEDTLAKDGIPPDLLERLNPEERLAFLLHVACPLRRNERNCGSPFFHASSFASLPVRQQADDAIQITAPGAAAAVSTAAATPKNGMWPSPREIVKPVRCPHTA